MITNSNHKEKPKKRHIKKSPKKTHQEKHKKRNINKSTKKDTLVEKP